MAPLHCRARRRPTSLPFLLLIAAVHGCLPSEAPRAATADAPTTSAQSVAPHLDRVLADYVDERGLVDYAALRADRQGLDAYVAWLARVEPSTLASWPRAGQMAFWINAYNGLTLRLIVDHYPIATAGAALVEPDAPANSVRQIAGAFSKISWPIAGRRTTLDQIEHRILRARFGDPRIHMALVRGARSCPPLRREPYAAETLDRQLDEQARWFLHSPRGLRFNSATGRGTLYLSSIFRWHMDDFAPIKNDNGEKGLFAFLRQYGPPALDALQPRGTVIRFMRFDWRLNEQPSREERPIAKGL